jgi:hypothetical protein
MGSTFVIFCHFSRVVGTLMSWFTQRQLNNLRVRLDEVQNQQTPLLHVQAIQMQQINEIDSAVKQLYKALQVAHY